MPVACELCVVPGYCVCASEEAAVYEGEFPVFAVVNLPEAWAYCSIEQGFAWIGMEGLLLYGG